MDTLYRLLERNPVQVGSTFQQGGGRGGRRGCEGGGEGEGPIYYSGSNINCTQLPVQSRWYQRLAPSGPGHLVANTREAATAAAVVHSLAAPEPRFPFGANRAASELQRAAPVGLHVVLLQGPGPNGQLFADEQLADILR